MTLVAIDTSVLVGLVDDADKWHQVAVEIRDALVQARAEVVYFDCVLNETMSVLARRTAEQKRPEQLDALLHHLIALVPSGDITWISGDIQRLYGQVVEQMRGTAGALNFHDALMALVCRERKIAALISFDTDFDQISWLNRADSAEDVQTFVNSSADPTPADEKRT